jgi:serine/threonine protein kinase
MAETKCPTCQYVNAEGRDHCIRCNTPLKQEKPAAGDQPAPAQPEPEKKPGPQRGRISLRPGQIIAGRYTVKSLIGRGGMGAIFKVEDNTLSEEVALKTLLPQVAQDKTVVERFHNEARIARQLSHPNIVRVHDIGMADGLLYISMEYLKGRSLRGMLDALPTGQRLPVKTTLRIMDQLCAALEYAHQFTVHRDIKPENVMVLPDGTVKLMDFGISKLMANTRMTSTAMIMGTPYYMSPEQLKDSGAVDCRADIYSIGVMLYEILTGNLPTGVIKPASQTTRDVPPTLDPIIARCVEPNPDARFRSAEQLRSTLQPILEIIESGVTPTPLPIEEPLERKSSDLFTRVLGVGIIAVVFALSGLAMYKLDMNRRALAAGSVDAQPAGGAQSDVRTQYFAECKRQFEDYRARANDLLKRIDEESAASEGGPKEARAQGESFRNDANSEMDAPSAGAVRQMRYAVQCYMAVLTWPQDDNMVFVPPGEVDMDGTSVWVDGFFIDSDHVTWGEYYYFVDRSPEFRPYRQVIQLTEAQREEPIGVATFYDALACAASQGKLAPTETQWLHASATVPALKPEGPPEWTRTAYREPAQAPSADRDGLSALDVGVPVTVRWPGGSDDNATPVTGRRGIRFDPGVMPGEPVYWRFIREIPTDEYSVAEVLDGA